MHSIAKFWNCFNFSVLTRGQAGRETGPRTDIQDHNMACCSWARTPILGVAPIRRACGLVGGLLGDELTRRAHAQAGVRVDGVVVLEAGQQLLQDRDGIWPRGRSHASGF